MGIWLFRAFNSKIKSICRKNYRKDEYYPEYGKMESRKELLEEHESLPAELGVLEHNPMTFFDTSNKGAVNPRENSTTLTLFKGPQQFNSVCWRRQRYRSDVATGEEGCQVHQWSLAYEKKTNIRDYSNILHWKFPETIVKFSFTIWSNQTYLIIWSRYRSMPRKVMTHAGTTGTIWSK